LARQKMGSIWVEQLDESKNEKHNWLRPVMHIAPPCKPVRAQRTRNRWKEGTRGRGARPRPEPLGARAPATLPSPGTSSRLVARLPPIRSVTHVSARRVKRSSIAFRVACPSGSGRSPPPGLLQGARIFVGLLDRASISYSAPVPNYSPHTTSFPERN
jgi:hypothetical protein